MLRFSCYRILASSSFDYNYGVIISDFFLLFVSRVGYLVNYAVFEFDACFMCVTFMLLILTDVC